MNVSEAERLARSLLAQHGLAWSFRFSRSKRLLGQCLYPAVPGEAGTIVLSRPYVEVNDEANVRDSILHEIAHALTPGDGHGAKWRAKCREIGADPTRMKHDLVRPKGRYRAVCGKCRQTINRERLVVAVATVAAPVARPVASAADLRAAARRRIARSRRAVAVSGWPAREVRWWPTARRVRGRARGRADRVLRVGRGCRAVSVRARRLRRVARRAHDSRAGRE